MIPAVVFGHNFLFKCRSKPKPTVGKTGLLMPTHTGEDSLSSQTLEAQVIVSSNKKQRIWFAQKQQEF